MPFHAMFKRGAMHCKSMWGAAASSCRAFGWYLALQTHVGCNCHRTPCVLGALCAENACQLPMPSHSVFGSGILH